MDQRNWISGLALAFLAMIIMKISWDLGIGTLGNPQAGFMPFWIGILILVCSLVLLGMTLLHRSDAIRLADLWRESGWPKTVAAVVSLIIYIAALPVAGYLIATGILLLVLFCLNSVKLWSAALGAALSVGLTYGLFHFLIKTPLPRGIWGF